MRYLNRIVPILAVALTPLVISACSGGGDAAPAASTAPSTPTPVTPVTPKTPPQLLASLEEKGDLPKLDRTPSLTGTDANQNNIRDDVEVILLDRLSDPAQSAAARQLARALQSSLTVDTTDKEATDKVAQAMLNATKCLFKHFPFNEGPVAPAALAGELQSLTTNTKPRLIAYLKYNTTREGTVSTLPKGDTCE